MAPKKKPAESDLSMMDAAAPNLDDRLAAMMNVAGKQAKKWGLPHAASIPAMDPQQFRRRVFSTGLASLDSKLKIGGFPRGCIVEFYGPPHAGKTLELYLVISEVQHQCMKCEGHVDYSDRLDAKGRPIIVMVAMLVRGEETEVPVTQRTSVCRHCGAKDSGGLFVLFDQENSFDPIWAARQNIELSKFGVFKLPTGEHATEMLRTLMLQIKPDAVGIDSIAQLQPKTEQLKSEVDDSVMPGLHAKVMARLCRQITSIFLMDPINAPLVLWVNQVRADMTGYGADKVTGGFAPEHYSAVRIKLQPQQLVNQLKPEQGRNGKMTIKKCKVAEGLYNQTLEYVILPSGFDTAMDLYLTAVAKGVFLSTAILSGGHFFADDVDRVNKLASKKDEAIANIRANPTFADEIRERIIKNTVFEQPLQEIYIGDGADLETGDESANESLPPETDPE